MILHVVPLLCLVVRTCRWVGYPWDLALSPWRHLRSPSHWVTPCRCNAIMFVACRRRHVPLHHRLPSLTPACCHLTVMWDTTLTRRSGRSIPAPTTVGLPLSPLQLSFMMTKRFFLTSRNFRTLIVLSLNHRKYYYHKLFLSYDLI